MTPDRYGELLKALKAIQKKVAADLLAAGRKPGAVRERLLVRHREAEVGGSFDEWLKVAAARAGVQFLLRTAYVRVLEDLGLLDPPRLVGQAGWHAWKAVAPRLGRRSFFRWLFRDLAVDFPDLFTPGPDEPGVPSEDLCEEVWALWHREDGGSLVYELSDGDFDSRFLGDLYQDLDNDVRKRFALLQTPLFVERFILDYTLTPALERFDAGALLEKGETFRLLDPTCGSGHFLTGGFERLFAWWTERYGKADVRWRLERALESVWGSDLNPYAVAVARFRLLLAAREAARKEGVTLTLEELARLPIHLLACDSLIPWEGARGQTEMWEETDPKAQLLARYATPEERAANAAFLGRAFHAVVGNPPYITPKDPEKRDTYRVFWPDSCHMSYALAAPFLERFFRLAVEGGYVGLINANSFMKRQFGTKLVERVLPTLDLTHVVDVQGAYIPGNGTPSVVLFGRNQKPLEKTVRGVLGIKGEAKRPDVPGESEVWRSIVDHIEAVGFENAFVSVVDLDREALSRHPWAIGGGGALEATEAIRRGGQRTLGAVTVSIGVGVVTREDDLFSVDQGLARRVELAEYKPCVQGDGIRDWGFESLPAAIFPYGPGPMWETVASKAVVRHLWRWRAQLSLRVAFGKTQLARGLQWFEYSMLFRDRLDGGSLVFPLVSTGNHFVFNPGDSTYRHSATIIRLPRGESAEAALDLLGLLNSSTLGFWMRQVFHDKGNGGYGGGIASEAWERFHEYDSTKLQQAPITSRDRATRVALAQRLDALATSRAACLPAAVLASQAWTPDSLSSRLASVHATYVDLTEQMVALQEELDWLTYGSYGLLPEGTSVSLAPADSAERLAPGHRPFEIFLAGQMEDEGLETQWFARHGREPVTEFPSRYTGSQRDHLEARLALIESDDRLRLLEQPQFKRRWQVADFAAETKAACESWLLDRIEDLFAAGGVLAVPRPYTLEEVSSALRLDPRVPAVLEVLSGTAAFDLEGTVGRLLAESALPDNPYRLYTEEGIRKLRRWQWVWEMQELEDRTPADAPRPTFVDPDTGALMDSITVPPKFDKGDFRRAPWSQTRGKLNVPRERFIHFADLEPAHYGWNGWRDADRSAAQAAAADIAMNHPVEPLPEAPTMDDPRRCGPTVGLWESLPDLRRWAGREIFEEQSELARYLCGKSACPCEVVEAWKARQEQGGRPGKAVARKRPATVAPAEVPLERRLAVLKILSEAGEAGFTLAEMAGKLSLAEADGRAALLALVAEGSVEEHGRKKRYRIVRAQETLFP